jgi:ATP-dependent helicase/DNAse subunit B
MLTVISGPYYPHLEDAFVGRIRDLKKDPFTPILVVVPSGHLMGRVKWVLGASGLSLLNVHFHTFSSLAHAVVDHSDPLKKPVFSDPHFYDTLIKNILRKDRPFKAWKELAVPDGFPPAVKGTLRDLLDAGAPPDVVEAVKEGFLGKEVDVGPLKELLNLYRKYLGKLKKLPVYPSQVLIQEATARSSSSEFLRQFPEIIYYGFYDLTGLQAEFFEAVAKNFPSRLFFPYLKDHPAYQFAGHFRDSFLQPLIEGEVFLGVMESPSTGNGHRSTPITLVNVSGLKDEAWWVATEIRRLVQEKNIRFSEIAVVSRSVGRLKDNWEQELSHHGIPFKSSVGKSLKEYPQVAEAVQNLSDEILLAEDKDWPVESSWQDYSQRTHQFSTLKSPAADPIVNLMREELQALSSYDMLGEKVAWSEFRDTLIQRWVEKELPHPLNHPAGVSLLHAEAARGLHFKAVFLVGAEERVFPRIIQEDPFLRDDARRALFDTLGYKIGQKMAALEEERLLFEIITTSADDHLYIIHQRSNEEGSVVGVSPFVRSLIHDLKTIGIDPNNISLPRDYGSKVASVSPQALASRDALGYLLLAQNKTSVLKVMENLFENQERFKKSLESQGALNSFGDPGPHDGIIGPAPMESVVKKKSMSPTALEEFGMCPFKYFAHHILGLEAPEVPLAPDKIPADELGQKIHLFLKKFYEVSTDSGQENLPPKPSKSIFNDCFTEVFDSAEVDAWGLFPTLWASLRDQIKAQLWQFVQYDFADCHAHGWRPTHFEKYFEGQLPPPLDKWEWRGKMDRIDVAGNAIRIIDYKSGRAPSVSINTQALQGRRLQPPLYLALLAQDLKNKKEKMSSLSFLYQHVLDEDITTELSDEEWQKYREDFEATIQSQLDLLTQGKFPIMPHPQYCGWCEVAAICRKNHSISSFRSSKGPGEVMNQMRQKKAGRSKK